MLGRFTSRFSSRGQARQASALTVRALQLSNRARYALIAASAVGACAALYYYSVYGASASGYLEECLAPPNYPWAHKYIWKSYDHAAIRRGFKVYNEIGAACHSLQYRYYRQLIDVAYTEEEVAEIAAEKEGYLTEPDEEGEVHERTGVLNDPFQSPYKNEKEARALNNGAFPLDLSQVVRARTGAESYVLALLTGYRDPPHGIKLGENMYYNLYFPGCQIAMPPPLAEGAVTFDDGTEATVSQMAKDVTVFLTWSAFMEHDERHLMGVKSYVTVIAVMLPFLWWKKKIFSYIKKSKVILHNK